MASRRSDFAHMIGNTSMLEENNIFGSGLWHRGWGTGIMKGTCCWCKATGIALWARHKIIYAEINNAAYALWLRGFPCQKSLEKNLGLTMSTHFQWAAQQANVILACVNRGLPSTSSGIKQSVYCSSGIVAKVLCPVTLLTGWERNGKLGLEKNH